jgi:hypothetical protein
MTRCCFQSQRLTFRAWLGGCRRRACAPAMPLFGTLHCNRMHCDRRYTIEACCQRREGSGSWCKQPSQKKRRRWGTIVVASNVSTRRVFHPSQAARLLPRSTRSSRSLQIQASSRALACCLLFAQEEVAARGKLLCCYSLCGLPTLQKQRRCLSNQTSLPPTHKTPQNNQHTRHFTVREENYSGSSKSSCPS